MTTLQTADADALRALVTQLAEGWNAKNAIQFAHPFTDNADFVPINGMHVQGKAAIEHAHHHLFTSLYRDSTITLEVTHMRLLQPGVALVHMQNHNRWNRDGQAGELRSTITCVMVMSDQDWAITAFQNTVQEQKS